MDKTTKNILIGAGALYLASKTGVLKSVGIGATGKKVDIYSVNKNGNLIYEFSGTKKTTNQKLSAYLTSAYTRMFKDVKNIKSFNRNRIYFNKHINSYQLKQKDVIALQINNG